MTDTQSVLLDMLKWFNDLCDKNNIVYYAAGGTLLGAVRHNGFIPWDDDIDIIIPRDDYEKLIRLEEIHYGRYIIETPYDGNRDFLFSFSKIYDCNTTLIENVNPRIKRGVYIDIFPLDGIGNNMAECKKNYRLIDKNNMLLMTKTCRLSKKRSFYKNIVIFFMKLVPNFILNTKKISIKVDKLAKKNSFNEYDYVGNLMGAYRSREIFKKELLGERKKFSFEDTYIYGPQYYEEYLKQIYGDWQTLPPIEKRRGAHDYYYIDLKTSFKMEDFK